jgi:hypothetical protein
MRFPISTALILLIYLLAPLTAHAQQVVPVTVPAAYAPRAGDLCDHIRLKYGWSTLTWSIEKCANLGIREILEQWDRTYTTDASNLAARTAMKDAIGDFNTEFPLVVDDACGDGVVDTDLGEQCDGGAGCNEECRTQ